ncbi:MAG: hypothetical protein KMY54_06105 [Erysipelothrix sp.]|nr:hypothetical protein [Erysipelothrix sp.]
MFDNERLYQMRRIALDLASGIDPTSGVDFSEDTILMSKLISEFHKDVARFLEYSIKSETVINYLKVKRDYTLELDFYLDKLTKDRIEYSRTPITIGEFSRNINKVISRGIKKVTAGNLTYWLESKGFLDKEESSPDITYKRPTKKGEKIGISLEQRINKAGIEYGVCYYNLNAQKFIVEHIREI